MYDINVKRVYKSKKSKIVLGMAAVLFLLFVKIGVANAHKMVSSGYILCVICTYIFLIVIGWFSRPHEKYHQKEAMKYGITGKIIGRLFIFKENEYLTVKQCMNTLIAPFWGFNIIILTVGVILYLIGGKLSITFTLSYFMLNLGACSSDIYLYFKLIHINKTSKVYMKWDQEIKGVPQNIYFSIVDEEK
ncbi:hypothetical protein PBV87_09385 [Niameybacter massiliensis]|uniref:Uncharacterized protein n=1 Tax=Holtiella tumoricola TaxID=3018743 RepID=A0AA42J0X8_9FIRM|nr:metalloprotease family protein [Holtiella tumoricola]MDA3731688.1 hypothetical protein [Holtiella tumoricola]